MKKNPADCKFKILHVYAAHGNGWILLRELENRPFTRRIHSLSHFGCYCLDHICDDEYWFYDFNDANGRFDKFRLKIRLVPSWERNEFP